jgi:hypothetical protein
MRVMIPNTSVHLRVVPVLAMVLVLDAAPELAAQATIPESRSNVSGVLLDPSHAPLPDVTVALEDLARRATYRATTDRQGRFEFRDLPAGDYETEIAVPGFTGFREPMLVAGPAVDREIVLTLAAVEETFTVVAGVPAMSGGAAGRERGEAEPCEPRVDEQTQSPLGGLVRPPRMLARVAPVFPEHLREAEVGGEVRLSGRITAEGSPADVAVVDASHPDFATAAEEAVTRWTWEEGLLNCAPVDVPMVVTVRFVPQRP